jgi:hypothetical protein
MSEFKVGDLVKRPNGDSVFKVTNIMTFRTRYGRIRKHKLHNLMTGKHYYTHIKGFELHIPMKPLKKSGDLKFSFKHGI